MPNVVLFDFVDAKSGKITYSPPGSYAAATGYLNCQTGQNTFTGTNWRAFFSFDTSSLPDNALVRQVEFLVRLSATQPNGAPETYRLKFSIGTFIGAALNGNSTEFQAGALMVTLQTKPDDETWIDLDQDSQGPQSHVNLTGDTDVKVWDDSTRGSGDSSWGLNFNASKAKCKLRVTYTVPSATATGRGLAQALGVVLVPGAGSATGRGTVQLSAVVHAAGLASGTGCGWAALVAIVTVAGAATVVGLAFGACAAMVESAPAWTATGRGAVALAASVRAEGAALVTGVGGAEVSAAVGVVGSSTVTGWGTAYCEALVEEQTASATATGRGLVSCLLSGVHFDPLARHSASRSVRTGSVGARSVHGVHNRMASCGPKDLGLRGPRRLN